MATNYDHYLASLHVAKQQAGFYYPFEHGERYKWRGLIASGQQEADALLQKLRPIARIAYWPDYTGSSDLKVKNEEEAPELVATMKAASLRVSRLKMMRSSREIDKKIELIEEEVRKATERGRHSEARKRGFQLPNLIRDRKALKTKIAHLKEQEKKVIADYITGWDRDE